MAVLSLPSPPQEAVAPRGGLLALRAPSMFALTAFGCALVGTAAVAAALLAAEPLWQLLLVAGLASIMQAGAIVLLRDRQRGRVRLLGGELIIDAAFAYTVVVLASRPAAASLRSTEFVLGLAGLVLGATGLALARLEPATRGAAVRRAVIRVTGTILVAVAVGQLQRPGLSMDWNWIPFLGFAVPGMLVTLAAELAGGRRGSRPRDPRRALASIAGTALLLYGSVNNLGLGAGGWGAGVHVDIATAAIWFAAACLMVCGSSIARWGFTARGALLAVAGLVAMAICERSAILRADIGLGPVGAAVSHGGPILIGALVVLVALPMLAQRMQSSVRPAIV